MTEQYAFMNICHHHFFLKKSLLTNASLRTNWITLIWSVSWSCMGARRCNKLPKFTATKLAQKMFFHNRSKHIFFCFSTKNTSSRLKSGKLLVENLYVSGTVSEMAPCWRMHGVVMPCQRHKSFHQFTFAVKYSIERITCLIQEMAWDTL